MPWHTRTHEGEGMNIGQASRASGVSAKMIRHFETIGVLPPAARNLSGYRSYSQADLQRLEFIRRARDAGFSTAEIRALVSLWQDRGRPAREVRRLAAGHLARIQARIEELQRIAGTLSHLVGHCHGGERPECPILDALAAPAGTDPATAPEVGPRRGAVSRGQARKGSGGLP
jgi:MerR family copper efflux transcriptional regulator